MKQLKPIVVHAIWDGDAGVWVATSEDVPGLVTEAETAEQLEAKLKIMIPELLIENGLIARTDHQEIPFHLHTERDSIAQCC